MACATTSQRSFRGAKVSVQAHFVDVSLKILDSSESRFCVDTKKYTNAEQMRTSEAAKFCLLGEFSLTILS